MRVGKEILHSFLAEGGVLRLQEQAGTGREPAKAHMWSKGRTLVALASYSYSPGPRAPTAPYSCLSLSITFSLCPSSRSYMYCNPP